MLDAYRGLPHAYDEAVTPEGEIRPSWQSLLGELDRMSGADLRQRWTHAQTQIERDGVMLNPHDDDGLESRPWILDAIPTVFSSSEWNSLSDQLCQRMRVIEALLADLLGPQRLLRDQVIPPQLLYGHPGWYPAYQGLNADKAYLTYAVTDLARAADGTWWATGDRTRAPFGVGYVLENRIATSRMLSPIYRKLSVQRLAGFYSELKEQLRRLAPRFQENPRIVLWTDGPHSRGYFEDAYLARYLGYTLAEGDDLAVRDNRVQLLTLGGLLPVEVLLRRLNDDACDSVELDPKSQIGISSLLDVIRGDRVAVANQIGSRLAEAPAFLPYLNAVSEHLFGEELQLPTTPTWWCGDPASLEHVLANLEQLIIRPAFRMADDPPIIGRTLSGADSVALKDRIRQSPQQFVGQALVERSTTPVLTESGVEPWRLGLRAFLLNSEQGFTALPGGLARVSTDSDSLNFTMAAGERTQDVWVLSDEPVEPMSLLESSTARIEPRRTGAELPSRVADNLFWLGRYSERVAKSTRLLRTLWDSLEAEAIGGQKTAPLLRMLASQGQIDPDHAVPELSRSLMDVASALPSAVLDPNRAMSLRASVNDSVRTAARVRDRISQEMWRAIDRLSGHFTHANSLPDPAFVDMGDLLENVLVDLTAFAGLVDDSMTRTLGWRFLDLGRRIEWCASSCLLLRCFFVEQHSNEGDALETVLALTDGLITYRNRYLANFQAALVLDLLLTDTTNPRSMIYQLTRIVEHLEAMPGEATRGVLSPERRTAMSMANSVRLVDIYDLVKEDSDGQRARLQRLIARLENRLPKLSNLLTSRYLIHAGLPRHFTQSQLK